jgi:hypothetical protein
MAATMSGAPVVSAVGRHPLDLAHGENEISVVVANLTGVEWAATKITTVGLSAAVMTTIKSLTTEHPEFGQTFRV